jgi:hypothetical protein
MSCSIRYYSGISVVIQRAWNGEAAKSHGIFLNTICHHSDHLLCQFILFSSELLKIEWVTDIYKKFIFCRPHFDVPANRIRVSQARGLLNCPPLIK